MVSLCEVYVCALRIVPFTLTCLGSGCAAGGVVGGCSWKSVSGG